MQEVQQMQAKITELEEKINYDVGEQNFRFPSEDRELRSNLDELQQIWQNFRTYSQWIMEDMPDYTDAVLGRLERSLSCSFSIQMVMTFGAGVY
jgi:hypothetical protein